MMAKKGFTLVELAIVITIIGLLIGGVLKGQELLENARMTSSAQQMKSIDAAAVTFKDIYKYLPGDIASPASFIQNCTASPCNISGNGDGVVGPANGLSDEMGTFWLHLLRAGLIQGVDPNSTWTSSTYYAASSPPFPLGGKIMIRNYYTAVGDAWWPDGLNGTYWFNGAVSSAATNTPVTSVAQSMKLDLKMDDGKPWVGTVVLLSGGCGIGQGQAYDPNNTTLCWPGIRTGF